MAALVADALTAFRLCLTLYLVWIGFSSSDKVSALTLIVYALLVGWTADILDGWFARKSNSSTRFGHLDFPLDMAMVAGSLIGITALGYIPVKVTVVYFAVAVVLVWKFPSKSTIMAVACPAVFAPFILAAFEVPYAFKLSLLWALLALVLDWSRFEGVVLEFIDTFPSGKLKPLGEKWRKWRGLTRVGNAYNDVNGKM